MISGNDQFSTDSLSEALRTVRKAFFVVGLLSFAVNILMLSGPLFMLQVYDRILTSRSIPTLLALFILIAGLFAFLGLFDLLRTRILSRIAYWLDDRLKIDAFKAWIFQGLVGVSAQHKPLSDLSVCRTFVSSTGLLALFDLPWFPVYLAVVFILHFQLGMLAAVGAVLVFALAVVNEFITRKPLAQAVASENYESSYADQSYRNAQPLVSMGMLGNVSRHWSQLREQSAGLAQEGGERAEVIAALSKAIRMLLQSSILALGAYLAVNQEISPGTIVAASIIAGRALAPIDQTIGNWRNIIRARQAYRRLGLHLKRPSGPAGANVVQLPNPKGVLDVENVTKLAPDAEGREDLNRRKILQGISFSLQPGDGLGVIGPSTSGKSTLARLLVGAWFADGGTIRLDGATFDQWDNSQLGRHIGYLPQDIELLAGTVAQNIGRFDPEANDEDIVKAAKTAGVHEMILQMPDGYHTTIGTTASPISGGQRQRIALARAVYKTPVLVVLDEPNSNLDAEGDAALANAIASLRQAGSVVIVMAHRPSAIAAVDKILMLNNGAQVAFGPKVDVLQKVTKIASA